MSISPVSITFFACVLLLTSCSSNDSNKTDEQSCTTCKTEEAFPGSKGKAKTREVGGQTIHYLEINGKAVYEGDILLDSFFISYADSLRPFVGAGIEGKRWPTNTIPYLIDTGLADSQKVKKAIQHWEAKTPIRFRYKQSSDQNWIIFESSTGCSSAVGMTRAGQVISLASGCSVGNAIHEIGHAVGLFHENSRADRDSFLVINWDNIQTGKESNFKTYLERRQPGFDDGPFDFNSRMLYGPYSFSIDQKKPTITKKDGTVYRINWDSLSDGDVQIVNRMYPPLPPITSSAR